ncbi:MAG: hypothetical protein K2J47_09950 [Ruminococcus sp.]|nr:hypothetical protein [Ruminococcus sp.]
MDLQRRKECVPDAVLVTKAFIVERRSQIEERLATPTASTGTPIDDLNGIAKALAMMANAGGGAVAIGGGGVAEGIKNITELAQAEAYLAGYEAGRRNR